MYYKRSFTFKDLLVYQCLFEEYDKFSEGTLL